MNWRPGGEPPNAGERATPDPRRLAAGPEMVGAVIPSAVFRPAAFPRGPSVAGRPSPAAAARAGEGDGARGGMGRGVSGTKVLATPVQAPATVRATKGRVSTEAGGSMAVAA